MRNSRIDILETGIRITNLEVPRKEVAELLDSMEELRRILRLHVGLPTTGGALDDAAVQASSAR